MKTKFNQNGRILFEGVSPLTGQKIVCILTGLKTSTSNEKTGDMVQSWILLQDHKPNESHKNGLNRGVCGDCPHAGYNNGSCYVKWFHAPLNVYKAYKNKNNAIETDSENPTKGVARSTVLYGDDNEDITANKRIDALNVTIEASELLTLIGHNGIKLQAGPEGGGPLTMHAGTITQIASNKEEYVIGQKMVVSSENTELNYDPRGTKALISPGHQSIKYMGDVKHQVMCAYRLDVAAQFLPYTPYTAVLSGERERNRTSRYHPRRWLPYCLVFKHTLNQTFHDTQRGSTRTPTLII